MSVSYHYLNNNQHNYLSIENSNRILFNKNNSLRTRGEHRHNNMVSWGYCNKEADDNNILVTTQGSYSITGSSTKINQNRRNINFYIDIQVTKDILTSTDINVTIGDIDCGTFHFDSGLSTGYIKFTKRCNPAGYFYNVDYITISSTDSSVTYNGKAYLFGCQGSG